MTTRRQSPRAARSTCASSAGGGSDLPAFYRDEPGAIVSTAIDKYIYISVNQKFDRKIRASYSVTEIVDSVDQLSHELIREALRLVEIEGQIEITSISDIPSQGTGLGSSSTYTVGLLNALYAHSGRYAGQERLAHEACVIEIERCGKPIGKQDQYIAAYGGLQYIQFNPDESVFVDPIICRAETKRRLHERLLMVYTGLTRSANEVLEEQQANTRTDHERRCALRRMTRMAQDLRESLCRDDLDSFGQVLHEGWLLKQGPYREFGGVFVNGRVVVDRPLWGFRAFAMCPGRSSRPSHSLNAAEGKAAARLAASVEPHGPGASAQAGRSPDPRATRESPSRRLRTVQRWNN